MNSYRMYVGDHVHAFILFVASEGLVFWLAARPVIQKPKRSTPMRKESLSKVASQSQELWLAELAPEYSAANATSSESPFIATTKPVASNGRSAARLIVANYFGSSRSRIVSIEPGGIQRTLLPGQELHVTATAEDLAPRFRIVESDLATQVYVEGIGIQIETEAHAAKIEA
jgi:hypothetical protein